MLGVTPGAPDTPDIPIAIRATSRVKVDKRLLCAEIARRSASRNSPPFLFNFLNSTIINLPLFRLRCRYCLRVTFRKRFLAKRDVALRTDERGIFLSLVDL